MVRSILRANAQRGEGETRIKEEEALHFSFMVSKKPVLKHITAGQPCARHALKGHQQRFTAFPSPRWRTEGSFNALSCNGPPLSRVRYVCNMVTLRARSASLAGGGAPLVHARRRRQCSCRSRSPGPVGMCRVHWQAT